MRFLAWLATVVCAASAACVELPDEEPIADSGIAAEDSSDTGNMDSAVAEDSFADDVATDVADAGDTFAPVDSHDVGDTTIAADTAVTDTVVPPTDTGPPTTFAFPRCTAGDTCPTSTTDGSARLLGSQSVSGMRSPAFSPRSVRFDLNVHVDGDAPVCDPSFIDVSVESAASGTILMHGPSKPLAAGDSTVSYTTGVSVVPLVTPLKLVVERRAGTGCPSVYVTVKSTSTVTFIP